MVAVYSKMSKSGISREDGFSSRSQDETTTGSASSSSSSPRRPQTQNHWEAFFAHGDLSIRSPERKFCNNMSPNGTSSTIASICRRNNKTCIETQISGECHFGTSSSSTSPAISPAESTYTEDTIYSNSGSPIYSMDCVDSVLGDLKGLIDLVDTDSTKGHSRRSSGLQCDSGSRSPTRHVDVKISAQQQRVFEEFLFTEKGTSKFVELESRVEQILSEAREKMLLTAAARNELSPEEAFKSSFLHGKKLFDIPSIGKVMDQIKGFYNDNRDGTADTNYTSDSESNRQTELLCEKAKYVMMPLLPMMCYPLLGKWIAVGAAATTTATAAGAIGGFGKFPAMYYAMMGPSMASEPPIDTATSNEAFVGRESAANSGGESGGGSTNNAGVTNNFGNPDGGNANIPNSNVNPNFTNNTNVGGANSTNTPAATGGNPGSVDNMNLFSVLFPKWNPDTFLGRVCLLQIMEYVGSLFLTMGSVTGDHFSKGLVEGSGIVLSPNTCSLYLLGASWGPAIAAGELWRLITPMMLHANGFKLAVGASTSAFGLLGVWAAEVHMTWHLISDESKGRLMFWFSGMVLALFVMTKLAPQLDVVGHIGGVLGGYLMSFCLTEMREGYKPDWYDNAQKWARLGLAWFCFLGTAKVGLMNPMIPIPDCGSLLHPRSIMM